MKTYIITFQATKSTIQEHDTDIFITIQPNKNCAILHYHRKSNSKLSVEDFRKKCKIVVLSKHGDYKYL